MMGASEKSNWWLFVVLLVAVVLKFLWVGASPPPPYYMDEAYIASWAYQFATTGDPKTTDFVVSGLPPAVYVGYYMQGLWIAAFGMTLEGIRLWVLLMGFWGLAFVYFILGRATTPFIALLVMIFAVTGLFNQAYVRMETLTTLFLAGALWLHYHARERFHWYYAIGFLLAFSLEGHHVGIRFAIAFGIWYSILYLIQLIRHRTWRNDSFWGLVLGGVSYALIYIVIRAVLYGSLDAVINGLTATYDMQVDVGGQLPLNQRFASGMVDFILHYIKFSPLSLFIMFYATWLSYKKQDAWLRFWVGIFWLSTFTLFIVSPKPPYILHYALHHVPLLCLMAGYVFVELRRTRGTVFLVMLVLAVGGLSLLMRDVNVPVDSGSELVHVGREIATLLPPDVKAIVGADIYYWGLNHYRFYRTSNFAQQTIPDLLNEKGLPLPDIVIFTSDTKNLTSYDDRRFPNVLQYIVDNEFERVICLPAPSFNRQAEVFAHPSLNITPRDNCEINAFEEALKELEP